MISIKKITIALVGLLLFGLSQVPTLKGQVYLERISLSERSDGLGFVIRAHLTEAVDSFSLAQLEEHRVQIALYSSNLVISEPLLLPNDPLIQNLIIHDLEEGLGFEVEMSSDRLFRSNAYFDVNRRDVLIALTIVSPDEMIVYGDPLFDKEDVTEQILTPTDSAVKTAAPETTALDTTALDTTDLKTDEQIVDSDLERIQTLNHYSLYPGDPMALYLRWAVDTHQNRHLHYSGSNPNQRSIQSIHPWQNHHYFTVHEPNLRSSRFEPSGNLNIFSPTLTTTHNSDYPVGSSFDGALWQGRGYNTAFSMGVGFRHNYFEAVFRPVYVTSENKDFDLSIHPPFEGLSEYAMHLTYSDIPQRLGEDSVNRFDPGESYIRGIYRGWNAGLSTQRMRTGPAIHNPLMFGNHAPGFFHSFVGTDEPFEILKGRFDTRWFWGKLQDSGHFYADSFEGERIDSRFITGFTLNYTPDRIPGLNVGLTRAAVSYSPENRLALSDYVMAFKRSQEKNQLVEPEESRFIKTAFFIRWHFPESGFEAYAEWGRNDNRRGLRDMIAEPELNRGYVLGFLKRFDVGDYRRIIVNGEITNLENSAVTTQSRDFNIWYTHPVIQQGFTHRGKALGASIGPGSSTQQLHATYYDRFGLVGFSLGRIAHHQDRLFQNMEYFRGSLARPWIPIRYLHEVEMFGAVRGLVFLPGGFELQAEARYGMIESRNNRFEIIPAQQVVLVFIDEPNWNLSFTLRYQIQSHSR